MRCRSVSCGMSRLRTLSITRNFTRARIKQSFACSMQDFCSTSVRRIFYTQARTHTASMQQPTQFFDKKFVYAACAIGAAYALVIAGLGSLLGAQAAGGRGGALTASATA